MLSMGFMPPVDTRQITNRSVPITGRRALQSKTDLKGIITHASQSLSEVSGFEHDELIGQPQNILRHPDVPDTFYHYLWQELQADREFFGMVKNRCKNGDHYWVMMRTAPIIQSGKKVGYTSARFLPKAEIIPEWEQLFQDMRRAESKQSYIDERRFKPAYQILNRFIRRRGFNNLRDLVLSTRA
ncbi:MAG TPA: PAS domain S-box protein [Halothiobacillaceae bacterium]|nr:PAS domain S-box protein [Halothiobacillaceae bacterium]